MYSKNKIRRNIAALLMACLSASAFALTPGSGTWVKETASYGAPNLADAWVYVPSNKSPKVLGGKRALMLSLHGCGQTAKGNVIDKKFNWEAPAEQYGMVVVAPTVPSGISSTRTSSGCWDWFGTNHNRTSRDAVPLKKLLDALIGNKSLGIAPRANLDIDPNQVYISGFSSGAGLAHVMGCSFPDYFAGIDVSAGPALGSASTDIFKAPTRTPQQVADTCKAINGNNPTLNAAFSTQLASFIEGAADNVVKPTHNTRNREGMSLLYGANTVGGNYSDSLGSNGTRYMDGNNKIRISHVIVDGMGHAWPAGAGGSGGGTYVDYKHINYPEYVTKFFFDNNLRMGPVVTACGGGSSMAMNATISGSARANGSIAKYKVVLNGPSPINDTAAGSGANFTKTYGLSIGYYTGTVTATDNFGNESAACNIAEFLVLPEPGPTQAAPTGLTAGTPTQTSVTLGWNAVNYGVTGYNVYRDGTKLASTSTNSYSDLTLTAGKTYRFKVTATYDYFQQSYYSNEITVVTPAPALPYSQKITDTLFNHYRAGRLDWQQYLRMVTKYGYTVSVTLYHCGTTWTNSSICGPLQ